MKYSQIGNTGIEASRIALGMMRASAHGPARMQELLETAIETGINFVDHADIYGRENPSEGIFGEVMKQKPELREKFIIQTKCGICRGYYDSSYEHIMESVDQSLRRMNIDYIDFLLLHRPDALMEPEEIAKAFDELQASGKVRHFGVSNMNPGQIENIKRCVKQEISIDQVQMSIVHAPMIDSGIFVNMTEPEAVVRDGGLIDYAQCKNMTLQAWSVVQASWAKGSFLNNPEFPELNAVLERVADKYGITKAAAAIAWILRHPAKIQAIAGTANPEHLREIAKAAEVELTRPEWYELYLSAGRQLP
ncbi:MAG: aldo/keto reductase [Oscillospiraceae bacterium]|nr:aldo/keto reductase [Oscillospiraceae bacterium]